MNPAELRFLSLRARFNPANPAINAREDFIIEEFYHTDNADGNDFIPWVLRTKNDS